MVDITGVLKILLVEDDPDIRLALATALGDAGHELTEAADGAAGIERLRADVFDVIVSDIRLPKADGVTLFREARRICPRTEVILMTSFATVTDAVAALKEGAYDYLTKPFEVEQLVLRVAGIAEKKSLERELEQARALLAGAPDAIMVGTSPAMLKLLDRLSTVAGSDAPILVTGESGTGKELVARRIHARSARRDGPFVA
ncbi:MAG: response regulator, partial [Polyangiaceae bacterium]